MITHPIHRADSVNSTNLLAMFALLFCSGFAYYTNHDSQNQILVLVFLFLLFVGFLRRITITRPYVFAISLIFLISFGQNFSFESVDFIPVIGMVLKITTGFLVYKILNRNFVSYFIKAMRLIAMYSLILFIILNIIPEFFNYLNEVVVPLFSSFDAQNEGNIFIYVLDPSFSIHRNSGPFWEPGAFQGYLNLALFFSIIEQGKINSKKHYIFIFAILSCMSTTGYIVLFLQTFFFILKFKERNNKLILILPLFVIVGFLSYNYIPFLRTKIDAQLESSSADDKNSQRFNSLLRDVDVITNNFLFGTGQSTINRYGIKNKEDISYSTTGITNFIATYGIIVFTIYIFGLYFGMSQLLISNGFSVISPFVFLIIFLVISFSEGFPFQPIFLGLAVSNNIFKST